LLEAQPKSDLANRLLRFLLRHVWLSPWRLRVFFRASRLFRDLGFARLLLKSRLLPSRAEFGVALLESSKGVVRGKAQTRRVGGQPVLLFEGCVGEGLFARVNRATERVLNANAFDVKTPTDQVCCGALHAHAGDLEGARHLARKNIAAFDSHAPIVTNAGGCGAMLKTYGHLLANDEKAMKFSARVRDVSQQLATVEMRTAPSPVQQQVTYDTSCHLMYGQGSGEASERMLRSVTGKAFVALNGTERCCGAAGVYNLLQPEMSGHVLKEKLDHIRESGATILATGNPGCQMHIGAGACLSGMKLSVCHPVEIVDQAYQEAGYYDGN
jgi:glycolate oxidase iron-sulfur subunit